MFYGTQLPVTNTFDYNLGIPEFWNADISFSKFGDYATAGACCVWEKKTLIKAWHDFYHRRTKELMTDNRLSQSICLQTHPFQGSHENRRLDQTQFPMSQSSLLGISCSPHALLGEPGIAAKQFQWWVLWFLPLHPKVIKASVKHVSIYNSDEKLNLITSLKRIYSQ